MGVQFKDKIVLRGWREGYCECGPATEILCWVYDVLDELYLICLSDLMSSKADSRSGDRWSFPRRWDFSILILWNLYQKAMGAETEDLILFFGLLGMFICWRVSGDSME